MVDAPRTHDERFLVLAPTGRDAALTCTLLEKAGMSCHPCADIQELCALFDGGAAGLLIAEEVLVRSTVRALQELLASQPSWSDIPVLIFTGKPAFAVAPAPAPQLLETLGNVTLLERPLRPITVVSAVRSALRARLRQYDARAELAEQQRAVRQRDQFLAMLGHELRNPLSAITMALNLEKDKAPSKYRDIVQRQVGHLARLVDDLLDVSRVTSGKVSLQRELLDLGALAQRCVSAMIPLAQAHQTTLHFHGPEQPLLVPADPVRVEQIIANLVTNARKYSPSGGTIDVDVRAEEGDAVIEVRDTGVGIAPEMLHRVFDLFTQVEGTLDRAKGGMGIGLTLVRSLVELHGGSVRAESEGLGKGSVFTVRLPLSRESQLPPPPMTPARAAEGSGRSKLSVLVIEDNVDSRELLHALLLERGHQVSTAADGLRGVELALAERPQVLLVDIGLPELDGYDVARRVRAALGKGPLLVAITGYGQPEDRRRAHEAGFDVHLTKPLDVAKIDALLSGPAAAFAERAARAR